MNKQDIFQKVMRAFSEYENRYEVELEKGFKESISRFISDSGFSFQGFMVAEVPHEEVVIFLNRDNNEIFCIVKAKNSPNCTPMYLDGDYCEHEVETIEEAITMYGS